MPNNQEEREGESGIIILTLALSLYYARMDLGVKKFSANSLPSQRYVCAQIQQDYKCKCTSMLLAKQSKHNKK